ncbi:MAG: hypothetical protein ACRC62_34865 [Microcoleus sp.]
MRLPTYLTTINYQSIASGDARTTTRERGRSHYNYQSIASGDARTTTLNSMPSQRRQ